LNTLLSINNYFYLRDGAATVFFQHNDLMAEKGWEVSHFAMQHADNEASPWSGYFVDEMEFGQRYSAWQKVQRAPRFVYSFQARKRLKQLLDAHSVSVCHCHCIYHHISPSILSLLKSRNIPVVMTMHDLKPACPAYFMYRHGSICEDCKHGNIHKVVSNRCSKDSLLFSSMVYLESLVHKWLASYEKNIDCFIAPSEFYIRKFSEFGFARNQFVHIPNPADIHEADRFSPADKEDFFIYAGRLSEEKGVDVLLHAAAKAGIKLLIAGDGPQRERLQLLAENLSVNAEFLGFLPQVKLLPLLARARASVLPALWYENAPMSILESLVGGTPAIASNIGGIPEMLGAHEGGELLEAGNVEALAESLSTYKNMSSASLQSKAEAGFDFVRRKHSKEQYQRSMTALYSKLQQGAAA
jgi:glycosyltransferase involved in cell wall biosynthesis